MSSSRLLGYSLLPTLFHQRLMLSTANSVVSWSMPSALEAAVVHKIVDDRWDGFPICDGEIIIDIHGRLLFFGLPCSPSVLEIPHQLFLLTIDRNDRLPFSFKSFAGAIDVLKLGIAVGMRCSLNALLGGFEGKPHRVYHPPDRCLPIPIPLSPPRF